MASIKKQLYNARSEYNRLLREIQSQGYTIAPDRKIELPKIPKTPTASSVKRIKKMTEQLKKSATKTVLDSKGRPTEHSYGYIKKREGVEKAKRTRASKKKEVITLTEYIFNKYLEQLSSIANDLIITLTDQKAPQYKIKQAKDAYELIVEEVNTMRESKNADEYAKVLQQSPVSKVDLYNSVNAQYYINGIRRLAESSGLDMNNFVQAVDNLQNIAEDTASYDFEGFFDED